jgi:ubiquitin carboxyl-terminal hydrolase 4/11/15
MSDGSSTSKRCASEAPTDTAEAGGGIEQLSLTAGSSTPPRSTPPSKEEQARLIKEQIERRPVLGDTWYLLPRKWQREWDTVCHHHDVHGHGGLDEDEELLSVDNVGAIDTRSLVDVKGALLTDPRPQEDVDFSLIHEEGWDLLTSW